MKQMFSKKSVDTVMIQLRVCPMLNWNHSQLKIKILYSVSVFFNTTQKYEYSKRCLFFNNLVLQKIQELTLHSTSVVPISDCHVDIIHGRIKVDEVGVTLKILRSYQV